MNIREGNIAEAVERADAALIEAVLRNRIAAILAEDAEDAALLAECESTWEYLDGTK